MIKLKYVSDKILRLYKQASFREIAWDLSRGIYQRPVIKQNNGCAIMFVNVLEL